MISELSAGQYLLLFVFASLMVGLLTPIIRILALKLDVVDRPNSAHKTHNKPVPYLGGVSIAIGVLIATLSIIIVSGFSSSKLNIALSVLLPALALGVVGLVDDLRDLPPWPRFLMQNSAGSLIALVLIGAGNLGNPSGNLILDFFISVFWFVGIVNSINFFDNLDGGAAGTVAVISFGLFVLALMNGQFLVASLSILLSGALIGFLYWNRNPARIYMGDAGSLFIGTILAVLAMRLNPDVQSIWLSFSIPLLLFALPILDTSVAVTSRLIRRKSPFQGGQDHLSHRLIFRGNSKKRTAAILWSLAGLFCLISVLVSTDSEISNLSAGTGICLWLSLFIFFSRSRFPRS